MAFRCGQVKKEKRDTVFRQPDRDNIEDVTGIQRLQKIFCQNVLSTLAIRHAFCSGMRLVGGISVMVLPNPFVTAKNMMPD